ncbi:MAG: hypothetical protein OXH64_06005 [Rhodospirillaceae bacterium]|nr:hypothetical protein [Rhodospirillaceae bacterium]
MFPNRVYIDANLLVHLELGTTGKDLIAKHRRLRTFEIADYERLVRLINETDRVLVTPNILTEASNLLAQHAEPERSHIFDTLRTLIREAEETVVTSRVAADNSAFNRLGLTDAALLEVVSKANPLITVDLDLYLAASAKESEAAFNFRHYQFRS